MQSQIKIIQEQLNKLCSQHDQLMALLDFYDFIPNLKSLQQTNRNISSRITNFEQDIEDLQQTNSTIKLREQIHLKTKQEEFKASMEDTQTQLHELNTKIQQQKKVIRQLEKGRVINRQVLNSSQAAKRKIKVLLQSLQAETAEMVAAQTVAMRQNKVSNLQMDADGMVNRIIPEQIYSYQQLIHEIELQQLQIQPPPFSDFVQFTLGLLKKQILMTNQKVLNLQMEQKRNEGQSSRNQILDSQMKLLNRNCDDLGYRVRAFKRYCGEQLLLLYSKSQQRMEIAELQRSTKQKIRQIQHLLDILKNTLSEDDASEC